MKAGTYVKPPAAHKDPWRAFLYKNILVTKSTTEQHTVFGSNVV